MSSEDWITTDLSSGVGDARLNITIDANSQPIDRIGTLTITGGSQSVTVEIDQDAGELVSVLDDLESEVLLFPNPTDGKIILSNLPSGIHSSLIEITAMDGSRFFSNEYQITDNEVMIDMEGLASGTYLMNIKLMRPSGSVYSEMTRKFVRN